MPSTDSPNNALVWRSHCWMTDLLRYCAAISAENTPMGMAPPEGVRSTSTADQMWGETAGDTVANPLHPSKTEQLRERRAGDGCSGKTSAPAAHALPPLLPSQLPLSCLLMVGTHNSGTYAVSSNSAFGPDAPAKFQLTPPQAAASSSSSSSLPVSSLSAAATSTANTATAMKCNDTLPSSPSSGGGGNKGELEGPATHVGWWRRARVGALQTVSRGSTARWSRFQSLDVYAQLCAGVRMLDLRLSRFVERTRENGGGDHHSSHNSSDVAVWYTSHHLLGSPFLLEVVPQILQFVDGVGPTPNQRAKQSKSPESAAGTAQTARLTSGQTLENEDDFVILQFQHFYGIPTVSKGGEEGNTEDVLTRELWRSLEVMGFFDRCVINDCDPDTGVPRVLTAPLAQLASGDGATPDAPAGQRAAHENGINEQALEARLPRRRLVLVINDAVYERFLHTASGDAAFERHYATPHQESGPPSTVSFRNPYARFFHPQSAVMTSDWKHKRFTAELLAAFEEDLKPTATAATAAEPAPLSAVETHCSAPRSVRSPINPPENVEAAPVPQDSSETAVLPPTPQLLWVTQAIRSSCAADITKSVFGIPPRNMRDFCASDGNFHARVLKWFWRRHTRCECADRPEAKSGSGTLHPWPRMSGQYGQGLGRCGGVPANCHSNILLLDFPEDAQVTVCVPTALEVRKD